MQMNRPFIHFTSKAPAPGLMCKAPSMMESFTGDVAAMDERQTRALRGIHARKARLGKSVTATGNGSYQITLIYENRSSEPRQNVRLEEFVPPGFAISTRETCEVHETPDGSRLAWTFDTVDAGKTREITFTLSGHGSLKHPASKAFR